MSTFEHRIDNYKRLQADMLQTFVDKDSDYGDSFGKTYEKYGIVSALTRMSDKLNRIDNLTAINSRDSSAKMKVDESIEDTLLDLANYAMLTYLQIHKFDEPVPPFSEVDIKPGEVRVASAGITTGELNKKAGTALANISKKLEETQAKGRNKEEDANKDPKYRAPLDSEEFNRRSIEVNRPATMFIYPGTNSQPLSLEETEDFNNYMNARISLEDLVNNLYSKIAVPGE